MNAEGRGTFYYPLAYLVLHPGSAHRRETLAGLIWPDSPEEIARRNLRQQLWLIRKTLATTQSSVADSIQADEISIRFIPPRIFGWMLPYWNDRSPQAMM